MEAVQVDPLRPWIRHLLPRIRLLRVVAPSSGLVHFLQSMVLVTDLPKPPQDPGASMFHMRAPHLPVPHAPPRLEPPPPILAPAATTASLPGTGSSRIHLQHCRPAWARTVAAQPSSFPHLSLRRRICEPTPCLMPSRSSTAMDS
ncbi:hypothetical protein VPH35_092099 [Triticum aestivum]